MARVFADVMADDESATSSMGGHAGGTVAVPRLCNFSPLFHTSPARARPFLRGHAVVRRSIGCLLGPSHQRAAPPLQKVSTFS
ncbi:hypothetical protein BDA96_01G501300 [Sorghum bicolor]|uniref:Uncharacterized protein n=2 Tax=Sorghum bicolor TaxID=4558 RepID=A0A1B6QPX1_SORBI|nr:hypothetical protein BDA96_01G501300 [Sorghum bicolor]KXG39957.1 hypothetical protein SORBI_3001G470300 [Sorghum bicolor]